MINPQSNDTQALLVSSDSETETDDNQPNPILSTAPTDIETLKQRSNRYIDEGRYQDALIDLNAMLEHDSTDMIETLYARSQVYEHLGDMEMGLLDLNAILDLDLTQIKAREKRIYIYFDRDQYDDALHDLNFIVDLDPTHVEALKQRTAIYLLREQYDDALTDLNALLNTCPEHEAMLIRQRMIIFTKLNRLDKVVIDLSTLLAQTELHTEHDVLSLKLERAQVYIKLNKIEDAFIDLNSLLPASIDLFQDKAQASKDVVFKAALIERMKLYNSQNELDKALIDVNPVIDAEIRQSHTNRFDSKQVESDHIHALIFRSNIYLKQHKFQQALEDLNTGLKKYPTNIKYLALRHTLLIKLGKDKQAVLDEYAMHHLNLQSGNIPSLAKLCTMAIYKHEPRIHANGNVFGLDPVKVRYWLAHCGINRVTLATMQEKLNDISPNTNQKTIFGQLDRIQASCVAYANIACQIEDLRERINATFPSSKEDKPNQAILSKMEQSAELPPASPQLSYADMREKRRAFFEHQNHDSKTDISQDKTLIHSI